MSKGIGGWAFIIGLVLAVVIAIVGAASGSWAYWVLAVLGLIVGLLNITDKEVVKFLVAAIAFMVTFQALGGIVANMPLGDFFARFFQLVSVFIAPATAVVALVALYGLTRD